MRTPLVIWTLCLVACATGRIKVMSDRDDVRFNFERSGKPVLVGGISVFEVEQGRRGRTVCDLNSTSRWMQDLSRMDSWIYGREVVPNYRAVGCIPLIPGREYGVLVHSVNCMFLTHFTISENGTVLDLGPGNEECYM
jgi:hypothetical protein